MVCLGILLLLFFSFGMWVVAKNYFPDCIFAILLYLESWKMYRDIRNMLVNYFSSSLITNKWFLAVIFCLFNKYASVMSKVSCWHPGLYHFYQGIITLSFFKKLNIYRHHFLNIIGQVSNVTLYVCILMWCNVHRVRITEVYCVQHIGYYYLRYLLNFSHYRIITRSL